MKIAINSCYGGFKLSENAIQLLALYGVENYSRLNRNDDLLIHVIEELGDKANTSVSKLKIIDIPDDIDWEITEYDGYEQVEEEHRVWS